MAQCLAELGVLETFLDLGAVGGSAPIDAPSALAPAASGR
jgi:hypothetical protein